MRQRRVEEMDASGQERGAITSSGWMGGDISYCAINMGDGGYAPCLTLRLEQSKDVLLTDRALDVADDRPGGVVHELDANLRHTTTRPRAAEDLGGCSALMFWDGGRRGRVGWGKDMDLDDFSELDGGF